MKITIDIKTDITKDDKDDDSDIDTFSIIKEFDLTCYCHAHQLLSLVMINSIIHIATSKIEEALADKDGCENENIDTNKEKDNDQRTYH